MMHTCGTCKHLRSTVLLGCPMYHCNKTGFMVPQNGTTEKCTFHRVPVCCPLPDSEVKKSETPAAQRHWVTINHIETVK